MPPVARPAISFIEPPGPDAVEIPEQKQHFDLPVRFDPGATFAFARTGVLAVTFLWQTAAVSSGASFTPGDNPPPAGDFP